MAKLATVFILTLLLVSTLSFAAAARSGPAFPNNESSAKSHQDAVKTEQSPDDFDCEGVGEEECLMRRTLAAHVDYIYTQKQNP